MQIGKHFIYNITLVIITIIISSCSVSRHATSRYQTISQRAQVTLEWDKNQYSVSSLVRIWKGELITFSIQPMLGLEMVRIEATPDNIWIFDKINRQYVVLTYGDIEKAIGARVTYKKIQDFASKPITEKGKEHAALFLKTGEHHFRLSCRFSNREYNTLNAPIQTKSNKYKQVTLREILPI